MLRHTFVIMKGDILSQSNDPKEAYLLNNPMICIGWGVTAAFLPQVDFLKRLCSCDYHCYPKRCTQYVVKENINRVSLTFQVNVDFLPGVCRTSLCTF